MGNQQEKQKRRSYTAQTKAAIIKAHLVDKMSISDLCDKHQVQPSLIYGWLKQLFDNLPQALEAASNRHVSGHDPKAKQEIDVLKERLTKKDTVIAEISSEYIQLKKALGDL